MNAGSGVVGGDVTGGSVAGGIVTGGSVAGGSVTGGSVAGGSVATGAVVSAAVGGGAVVLLVVVISVLGTTYALGKDVDEGSDTLRSALQGARWPDGKPVFTAATALGLMVFFALCLQCVATVATIRRETQSWKWPAFAWTYMTVLAYAPAD